MPKKSPKTASTALSLRNDCRTMKHCFFPLSTGDHEPRYFEFDGCQVEMLTSTGHPSIHDKDFLIYVMSEMHHRGTIEVNGRLEIAMSLRQLLEGVHREWGGKSHANAMASLKRLFGTAAIVTSRDEHGTVVERGIHLLAYEMVRPEAGAKGYPMLHLSLHGWFAKTLLGGKAISMRPDYFDIEKGLDKRLYELARVSASSRGWKWRVATLFERVGAKGTLARFRYELKKAAVRDTLLDYVITIDPETDTVTFSKRVALRKGAREALGCQDGDVQLPA